MTDKIKIIEKRAFTVTEAAEYACVSRGTLNNWLAKGLLKYEELPGNGEKQRFIRIRKKDLDEFLDRCIRESKVSKLKNAKSNHKNTEEKLNSPFLLPKKA